MAMGVTESKAVEETGRLEEEPLQRKRAEETLRESEEKYRNIFETAPDGIVTINLKGIVTSCNSAFTDITGFSKSEIVGQHFSKLPTLRARDIPQYIKLFNSLMRGKVPKPFEARWLHKDGTTHWAEIRVSFMKEGRKTIGFQASERDITERKQSEEKVRRRSEELAALNAIATTMTSTLDLQEVLQAIQERVVTLLGEKYPPFFSLFDEGNKTLEVVVTGTAKKILERAEKLMGVKLEDLIFPLSTVNPAVREALLAGKPYVTDDVSDLLGPRVSRRLVQGAQSALGVNSIVDLPLRVKGKFVGIMALLSQKEKVSDKEMELLSSIASQAAIAIENARLYEQAQARSAYLATLLRINATLRSTLPLSQVLETIVQGATKALGYVGSLITVPDATGDRLVFGAAWGGRFVDAAARLTGFKVDSFRLSLKAEENPIVQAYLTGELQVLGGAPKRIVAGVQPTISPKLAKVIERTMGAELAACVPLPVGDKVVGVLSVFSPKEQLTDEERAMLLGLADQAGLAIENARLYEETQHHLTQVTALREIDRTISSTLDLSEVLDIILEQLERVIPYTSATIFLLTDDLAKVTAARGFPNLEKVMQVSFLVREDPLARQLLEERRPLFSADAQADERFQARGGTEYVRSWIGVPLIAKGEAIGFLTIDHREAGVYDEESAETALAFANQVAIAIENARLFKGERRRATHLAVINEVSRKAISILDLDEMLEEVARSICRGFDYYNVALFLVDKERHDVVMEAVAGGFEHYAPGEYRQPLDQGILGWVIRTGRSWLANDVSQDPYYIKGFLEEVSTESELCVPIKLGGEVIGALDIQSIHLNAFDETDVTAMETLSGQLAIAIKTAGAYERLKTQNLETISALAAAVEAKDPYTSGHSEKVTQFALAIAEKMGLSHDEIEDLRVAGLLHDIGKIGIPDSVLNKPARLTPAEFLMVKTHPVIAAEIVKRVETLAPIVPIIRHHHERYDGQGYPDGLTGKEIPLGARILAVADGFDAMTSERPYRRARTEEEALAELEKGAGTQWDPQVVEVFAKTYEGGIVS